MATLGLTYDGPDMRPDSRPQHPQTASQVITLGLESALHHNDCNYNVHALVLTPDDLGSIRMRWDQPPSNGPQRRLCQQRSYRRR